MHLRLKVLTWSPQTSTTQTQSTLNRNQIHVFYSKKYEYEESETSTKILLHVNGTKRNGPITTTRFMSYMQPCLLPVLPISDLLNHLIHLYI